MSTERRAREMRADGKSFSKIASELGVSLQWAYKCVGGVAGSLLPTKSTIVKQFARNGGCSTQSGMVSISLPRITSLHGAA